jgi:hypothetical protein
MAKLTMTRTKTKSDAAMTTNKIGSNASIMSDVVMNTTEKNAITDKAMRNDNVFGSENFIVDDILCEL